MKSILFVMVLFLPLISICKEIRPKKYGPTYIAHKDILKHKQDKTDTEYTTSSRVWDQMVELGVSFCYPETTQPPAQLLRP